MPEININSYPLDDAKNETENLHFASDDKLSARCHKHGAPSSCSAQDSVLSPAIHIGYHESSSAGYAAMGQEAVDAGGSTFAFFTRNPRGGKAKPIEPSDAAKLCAIMEEHRFAPIVAHAPYTMNPCSQKKELREYALDMLTDDLIKLKAINGVYYNLHPGCHTGQGEEEGVRLAAATIAEAIKRARENGAVHTTVLIETMAGKGSEIGASFESVKNIIDAIDTLLSALPDASSSAMCAPPFAPCVCLDTCHLWDAGYDIAGDLDGVLNKFDKIIGLDRLKAVHLNDSMNERASHKDRHQKIGQGFIGFDALYRVTRHPALRSLPFILETPNDANGYKDEIRRLLD